MINVEKSVEQSLEACHKDGLLAWTKCRGLTPEGDYDPLGNWIHQVPSAPLYSITLLSGIHLWLEVIKATSRDIYLDYKSVPQFREMVAHQAMGALCFFLVFWVVEKEWRLYQPGEGGEGKAEFIRPNGTQIEEVDGYPDWLWKW